MNILSPVDNIEDIALLSKAGATELYCGYVPLYWRERYNKNLSKSGKWTWFQIPLNKRDSMSANVGTLDELKLMVAEARNNNVKLFLALNALCFPGEFYDFADSYLNDVISAGIDGIIVTDIGLINYLKLNYPNVYVILSTCQPVSNNYSSKFFADMGVNRITFPRRVTVEEIVEITNSCSDVEYEYFVTDGKCIYDDGSCKIFHNAGSFCLEQWEYNYFRSDGKRFEFEEMQRLYDNEQQFVRWTKTYPSPAGEPSKEANIGCALCSLPDIMHRSKISTLKLAGRGLPITYKLWLVRHTKRAIELAEKLAEPEDIRNYVLQFLPHKELCENKVRCLMASNNYDKRKKQL